MNEIIHVANMDKEEIYKYFWLQYHSAVKAVDLPLEYKIYDKRVGCSNVECFCREHCLFHQRFLSKCAVFKMNPKKQMREIKAAQSGKFKRCEWDKYYPTPDYKNATFDFFIQQHGAKPCMCFINKT